MATLFIRQGSRLCTVIGALYYRYAYEAYIGLGHLANNFYTSCGDEQEFEVILLLLCTYPALGRRRKSHLDAYYTKDLDELS